MEGLGELEKILGGGAGITALLIFGGKWLINAYFAKAKEVEELRTKNISAQENRLDDAVKNFRAAIDSIQSQIKDLSANLTMTRSEAKALALRIEQTEKLLEQYTSAVDSKVSNMIKSEIVELTKKIMMIRTKKDGA